MIGSVGRHCDLAFNTALNRRSSPLLPYFLISWHCQARTRITRCANSATLLLECQALAACLPYRTPIGPVAFASSVHGVSHVLKGNFMKKVEDQMRPEYKRADFVELERGKFFKEVAKGTSVALIDPQLAKAFPTSARASKPRRA